MAIQTGAFTASYLPVTMRLTSQCFFSYTASIKIRTFVVNRWDKIIYAFFFFILAVVGSLLGGASEFPKWIFIILIVMILLYMLNKDRIDKNFRK